MQQLDGLQPWASYGETWLKYSDVTQWELKSMRTYFNETPISLKIGFFLCHNFTL